MRCSRAARSASSVSAAPRKPAASPKRRSAASPARTLATQAELRFASCWAAARTSRAPWPICFCRSKACSIALCIRICVLRAVSHILYIQRTFSVVWQAFC